MVPDGAVRVVVHNYDALQFNVVLVGITRMVQDGLNLAGERNVKQANGN